MDYMDKIITKVKVVGGIAGGLLCSALGGWDLTLKILVCFMITDYAVGVTAGFINNELDSKIGFRGICKKILLLVPIGVAHALDILLHVDMFKDMATMFYATNEGISILENLSKAGVLVPETLRKKLVQLQEDGMNEDSNISRT